MTDDRWRRIEELYHAALERDERDRAAFLAEACGGDEALRLEVESLLASDAEAHAFLAEGAMHVAARDLAGSGVSIVGRRLGAYQILAPIGAGGMGEVYRARDTRLGRDVAIKILPRVFTADTDRLARFEREARVLASLNHPHIGAIHGIEDAPVDGGPRVRALILELVEGETLAERIARSGSKGLPITEALDIARQIADALDAAHQKGIVHRDLKPANIKITPQGVVKVLDFGLAKASRGAAPADRTGSPTLTVGDTRDGSILGTAPYMSPEQARGQSVDKRTDIWAFGCVFYEMLTGLVAFPGKTTSDTIAAILEHEPDSSCLPAATPPTILRLLQRALDKDLRRRLHDIADARVEIDDVLTGRVPMRAVSAPSVPRARNRSLWLFVAATTIGLAILAVPALWSRREMPPETRVDVVTPLAADSDLASFALSPDGRSIVAVASGDGPSRLWLRSLASTTAEPLTGTENASEPFWSPDSRSIGFFADGKLKRLSIGGGAPQALAEAQGGAGGTWSADDVILFAKSSGPILRVLAAGGPVVAVTTPDRQSSHRFPSFLSDGLHFLFLANGQIPETTGLYLGTLGVRDTQRLTPDVSSGVYLSPGWLLQVRAGSLVAQRLDLERKVLIGDRLMVADPVLIDPIQENSAVSVSAAGLIAYRTGGIIRRQLTWFDRSGNALGTLGSVDQSGFPSPHVSPDGRRVAGNRTVEGNSDIWLLDGVRTTRLTFDAASEQFPVWSPEGSQIAFQSDRTGVRSIYRKWANGAGTEDTLVQTAQITVPTDWSPDGRFLLYYSIDPQTARDLWVLPLEGQGAPWVFLKTRFDERWGQFSPDGRWVAYMSNESGRDEIYIRPFTASPESGAALEAATAATGGRQVSTEGGVFPRWRADGGEIYYIGPRAELMATPITVTGSALVPGAPVELFRTRIVGRGVDNTFGPQYDVNREGHFLINTDLDRATTAPITLVQNWQPLAARVR